MRKKILIVLAVFWIGLTILLFSWSIREASAATPTRAGAISAEQLKETLKANPEVLLEILGEHSEVLLDIVQQGAILRRDRAIVTGWQRDLQTPKPVALNGRAMRGAANAPVTIVAFSDFTCSYCEQAAGTVKRVLDTYGDKVRYVFKAFPRDDLGVGRLAAEYFTAASLQSMEKAWELYDKLFTQRDALMRQGDLVLKETAKSVGLDMKRLATDLKGKAVKDIVEEDIAEATRHGIEGTPTFLVNNIVVRGAVTDELFSRAVDLALEHARPKAAQ